MGAKSMRVVLAVVISLLILGSGVWLIASGRPLGGGLLAAHKLLALAGLAFFGVTVYQVSRAPGLGGVKAVAALVTGLLFLAAVVSGAFAIQTPAAAAAVSAHRLTLTLALVSAVITLLLLLRGK
jgi:hypothetical protein